MFAEYLKKREDKANGDDDEFFNKQKSSSVKMTQKDIDEEFDNLDINQFNAQS